MSTSSPKIHVGMDVHKDTVMIAVLPEGAEQPTLVRQLPNDERKLRRCLARVAEDGELLCCYEASGAGYVLHRAIEAWGHRCEVIAPALIPTRPRASREARPLRRRRAREAASRRIAGRGPDPQRGRGARP